jgi:hypothetical protein
VISQPLHPHRKNVSKSTGVISVKGTRKMCDVEKESKNDQSRGA